MIAMIAGVVAEDVEGSVENAENAENAETVEDIEAIVEGEAVETLTVDHRVATRAPHHRKCGSPAQ
jgi:intracellular sulfur oxidation DsrE/DsrF family protein